MGVHAVVLLRDGRRRAAEGSDRSSCPCLPHPACPPKSIVDRSVPTVLRLGQYRLAFYSSNGSEPPHVHVISATGQAKFWLDSVGLARSVGLSARELRQVESIVSDNREQLLRSWHEYFDR